MVLLQVFTLFVAVWLLTTLIAWLPQDRPFDASTLIIMSLISTSISWFLAVAVADINVIVSTSPVTVFNYQSDFMFGMFWLGMGGVQLIRAFALIFPMISGKKRLDEEIKAEEEQRIQEFA